MYAVHHSPKVNGSQGVGEFSWPLEDERTLRITFKPTGLKGLDDIPPGNFRYQGFDLSKSLPHKWKSA